MSWFSAHIISAVWNVRWIKFCLSAIFLLCWVVFIASQCSAGRYYFQSWLSVHKGFIHENVWIGLREPAVGQAPILHECPILRWCPRLPPTTCRLCDLHLEPKYLLAVTICIGCSSSHINIFYKILEDISSLCWDHWYPCFGLVVMSSLGFKARMGSLTCTWWRSICYIFLQLKLQLRLQTVWQRNEKFQPLQLDQHVI